MQLSHQESAKAVAVTVGRAGHQRFRDGVTVALGHVSVPCCRCIVALPRPVECSVDVRHVAKVISCWTI